MLKRIIFLALLAISSNSQASKFYFFNSRLLQNFIVFQPNKTLKKYRKDVWSEIDLNQKVNLSLFKPYNEEVPGYDHIIEDIDPRLYDSKKEAIKWNLYTIIVSQFIKGELEIYSPFNPDWEAESDHGYLTYPITMETYNKSEKGNYQNNAEFKYWVKAIYLGKELTAPFALPLKSLIYPDEDSIIIDPYDSYEVAVYPPSDYIWFTDKDIIKYKLKETWIMNANGKVVNKIINSIAPVINARDNSGNTLGERTLFWVDFNDLTKKLTPHYTLLNRYKKEEIISMADYFDRREFYAKVLPDTLANIKIIR